MSYSDLHNDEPRPGRGTPASLVVGGAGNGGVETPSHKGDGWQDSNLGIDARPKGVSVVETPPLTGGTLGATVRPVDYLEKWKQRSAQAKEAEMRRLPGARDGGKGLTGWINRNFGPGDETLAGRRRAVQNITALGQMLRHAGNLAGVSRGATPQQIQDQVAINDALWKQEDALAYQREQQQREYERKLEKDKADADYKVMNLALGERKQAEAERNNAFNNNIALGRYGMDSETHGWKKEDRPLDVAKKKADVNRMEAVADKAVVEAQYAERKEKADLALTQQKIATAYAQAQHAKAATGKLREETKKLKSGGSDGYPIAGRQGKFTKKHPLDKDARTNIIKRAYDKGIITEEMYNDVHEKSAWETEKQFAAKQEDAIAAIVNRAGDEEVVRDIMVSHGYEYEPYTPVESKKNAKLK